MLNYETKYDDIRKDVRNFARRITINDYRTGRQQLQLRNYQNGLLKRFQRNQYTIVKHTRQCGVTTMACIYMLWFAMMNECKKVVICSPTILNSEHTLENIKKMYEGLRSNEKISVTDYRKHRIEFSNGSEICIVPAINHDFRGRTVDLLHLDNCAFISEAFLTQMNPIITGKIIITSCPNPHGNNNFFTRLYEKAKSNVGNFKHFNIRGFQVPNRNKEWMEAIKKIIGTDRFKHEYNWY